MAGYSGTPLWKKLGIKEGARLGLLGAPDGFVIDALPDAVEVLQRARWPLDVVVSFHVRRRDFERRLPVLMRALPVDGALWVVWPKRSSGVDTDITEDTIREVALPTGMVDNKVCAVDDTWSGLRLVLRKELRAGPHPPPPADTSGRSVLPLGLASPAGSQKARMVRMRPSSSKDITSNTSSTNSASPIVGRTSMWKTASSPHTLTIPPRSSTESESAWVSSKNAPIASVPWRTGVPTGSSIQASSAKQPSQRSRSGAEKADQ